MNIVIEFLGALFLPENKGLNVEMERRGQMRRRDDRIAVTNNSMRVVEEEMDVKRSAEEAAGPSESKEAEVGVVEGGGEVGIGSNWWLRQRKRKSCCGGSHFNRSSKTRRESRVIVAVFGLGNNLMRVHG